MKSSSEDGDEAPQKQADNDVDGDGSTPDSEAEGPFYTEHVRGEITREDQVDNNSPSAENAAEDVRQLQERLTKFQGRFLKVSGTQSAVEVPEGPYDNSFKKIDENRSSDSDLHEKEGNEFRQSSTTATRFRQAAALLSSTGSQSKKAGPPRAISSSDIHWSAVAAAVRMQRGIPAQVKARRMERFKNGHRSGSSAGASTDSEGELELPPDSQETNLHRLCAKSNVALTELQAELERDAAAASTKDDSGRLPLHVLGDNDDLLMTAPETAKSFAWKLMKVYPPGITTLDNDGFMPFVSVIRDWHCWMYEEDTRSRGAPSPSSSLPDKLKQNLNRGRNTIMRSSGRSRDKKSIGSGTSAGLLILSARFFPKVELWSEVKACFDILSLAMDELGGLNGGLHKEKKRHIAIDSFNRQDCQARDDLAIHLCTVIPNILKTIFLLDEKGDMRRNDLLQCSIVRRILVCKESIGPWITGMLQRKGLPSRRAIDYLQNISDITILDYVGRYRAILDVDMLAYTDIHEQVFEAVGDLGGTVASLVVLPTKEVERAASTQVVWQIMSRSCAASFTVCMTLIDLVLNVALLVAMNFNIKYLMEGEITAREEGINYSVALYIVSSNILIKKVFEAIAMYRLSPAVFLSYSMNVWTFIDITAIIMTIVTLSIPGYIPALYAVVIGFLWVRVLGFLKIVNRQMATFILSLTEILKTLIYFALVLLIVIFLFADMFRILITGYQNGQYCASADLNEASEDFCSPDPMNSYLRVYATLLGDFELDNFRETPAMTALFVFFTIIGVIILLNVLIAVISDSYENSKTGSILLFRRARVLFVAQNQALESFLLPRRRPIPPKRSAFQTGAHSLWEIVRVLVLLALIGLNSCTVAYLFHRFVVFLSRSAFISVISFLCGFLLVVGLVVFISLVIDNMVHNFWRGAAANGLSRVFSLLFSWCNSVAGILAFYLFGNSGSSEDSLEDDNGLVGNDKRWESQFHFLLQTSLGEIKAEISELNRRIDGLEKTSSSR